MEKMGIPTTPIITSMFEENGKAAAYKRGMPLQRFTYIPHPVAYKPVSLIREYAKGKDPVTGKPLMSEIVEALTKPLNAEEKKEQEVTITPAQIGDKQELEFLLYKGDGADVYESVHLWIDVVP